MRSDFQGIHLSDRLRDGIVLRSYAYFYDYSCMINSEVFSRGIRKRDTTMLLFRPTTTRLTRSLSLVDLSYDQVILT